MPALRDKVSGSRKATELRKVASLGLPQLCAALAGHPSLRRLALRRMAFHHSSQEVCDAG